jgi:hypothetical protein
MITPEYCQMMARYNAWQNQSLSTAATLDDAARGGPGRVLGSIRKTLSHLMWGDHDLDRAVRWRATARRGRDRRHEVYDWPDALGRAPKARRAHPAGPGWSRRG